MLTPGRTRRARTLRRAGTTTCLLLGATVWLLTAGEPAAAAPPGDGAVVVVVDVTGSMDAEDSEHDNSAVPALLGFVREVDPDVPLGIRSFGESCEPSTPLVTSPIRSGHRSELRSAIRALPASESLEQPVLGVGGAVESLAGADGGRIVLVTDGVFIGCEVPAPGWCQAVVDAVPSDVRLDVIGYPLDQANPLLACMAEQRGGEYFTAETPSELAQTFAKEINTGSGAPAAAWVAAGAVAAGAGVAGAVGLHRRGRLRRPQRATSTSAPTVRVDVRRSQAHVGEVTGTGPSTSTPTLALRTRVGLWHVTEQGPTPDDSVGRATPPGWNQP